MYSYVGTVHSYTTRGVPSTGHRGRALGDWGPPPMGCLLMLLHFVFISKHSEIGQRKQIFVKTGKQLKECIDFQEIV